MSKASAFALQRVPLTSKQEKMLAKDRKEQAQKETLIKAVLARLEDDRDLSLSAACNEQLHNKSVTRRSMSSGNHCDVPVVVAIAMSDFNLQCDH